MSFPKFVELVRSIERALATAFGSWLTSASQAIDYLLATVAALLIGEPFLTQTTWYVDSVNGNDANTGETSVTALKTLAELSRRWTGRVFAPSVTGVSVTLINSFDNELLDLRASFTAVVNAGDVPVAVRGTMTPAGLSGAITTYQAFVPGATRASVTDGTADFTAFVDKRIRITDGAAVGAVSTIASLGAGVTIANVGQFTAVGPAGSTGTTINPANGDHYIVENFQTKIRDFYIDCPGALVSLESISIQTPAGASTATYLKSQQATNVGLKIWGCEFNMSIGLIENLAGDCVVAACAVVGTGILQTTRGFQLWKNSVVLSSYPLNHALSSSVQALGMMHDGKGARNAGLNISNNSDLRDNGHRCFFGCTNGGGQSQLLHVSDGSSFQSNTFWGAAGNTTTNAVQIRNGCAAQYPAGNVPTATGATPGVNDVVIGGAGMAWGALPFANAAPDNAAFNVYQ